MTKKTISKPQMPEAWERNEITEIALANAIMCWDQHCNDSKADREAAAMDYAANAAETTREEGLGTDAWSDASSCTLALLQRAGFCE